MEVPFYTFKALSFLQSIWVLVADLMMLCTWYHTVLETGIREYLVAGISAYLLPVVVSDTPCLVVLLQERAPATPIEAVVF